VSLPLWFAALHTLGMDEHPIDTTKEATELHGKGVSGKLVVIVCLVVAALIGIGMIGALTNTEVDASYELPSVSPTATPRSSLPWGR
jgi:hypothetical protein